MLVSSSDVATQSFDPLSSILMRSVIAKKCHGLADVVRRHSVHRDGRGSPRSQRTLLHEPKASEVILRRVTAGSVLSKTKVAAL